MIAELYATGNRWCVKFPLNGELSSSVIDFDPYLQLVRRVLLALDYLQQSTHQGTQTQNGSLMVLYRPPTEYLYGRPNLGSRRGTTQI